ncbi:MAG: hypothetical protein ACREAX_00355, partial [Candidatus Nitrosotenuis sp.]
ITYDKYKPKQVTIVDPNKLFSSADFKLIPKDPRTGTIQFEITFAKPMDTSDIRLLAWDLKRNFVHKIYEDAVKVEKSTTSNNESELVAQPKTQEKITEKPKKTVPQKLLQKEQQKDKLDKQTEKKELDKLTKKTAKEKQDKKKLVSKLQSKSLKTTLKGK